MGITAPENDFLAVGVTVPHSTTNEPTAHCGLLGCSHDCAPHLDSVGRSNKASAGPVPLSLRIEICDEIMSFWRKSIRIGRDVGSEGTQSR